MSLFCRGLTHTPRIQGCSTLRPSASASRHEKIVTQLEQVSDQLLINFSFKCFPFSFKLLIQYASSFPVSTSLESPLAFGGGGIHRCMGRGRGRGRIWRELEESTPTLPSSYCTMATRIYCSQYLESTDLVSRIYRLSS